MGGHRERALHALLAVVAVAAAGVAAWLLTTSGSALAVVTTPVRGLPLALLLVAAIPVTRWLCGRSLRLTGLGGAVHVAPDSAVLALLLWAGLGALARTPDTGTGVGTVLVLCAWTWSAWLAGVAWSEAAEPRRCLWVRGFNVGLSALAGATFLAVAVVLRALTARALVGDPATSAVGPWDAVAVLGAAAAYVIVDLVLSALSVSLGEGGRLRDAIADESTLLAVSAVVTLGALAVLAATLLLTEPWTLVLLAPVVLAVTHAAGVGARASAERARSSALCAAAEACQRAATADEVTSAVLAGAAAVTAAPSRLAGQPPDDGQIGAELEGPDGPRWLLCGPRGTGHAFLAGDALALATLARLAAESLARVEGVAAVRELAARDPLTGLANRTRFDAALARSLDGAPAVPTAILFADVDEFKAVNDEHGHLCGDEVLVAVARRLEGAARPQDLVVRLGGDEFAVLLPATGAAEAAGVRLRVEEALSSPVPVGGLLLPVRVSVGAGASDALVDDGSTRSLRERLVDAADQEMYRTKRRARAVQRR